MRVRSLLRLLLVLPLFAEAFLRPTFAGASPGRRTAEQHSSGPSPQRPGPVVLYAGDGIATNYTWHEEALELEVSVTVPPRTRASDVVFHATSRTVALTLQPRDDDAAPVVLLDGNRPVRGRINLDGVYWVLSDAGALGEDRIVTVTLEKLHRPPQDDFEVVDYDWKGVYPDDEAEVTSRKYDEPESLNVREYAANMGVDIDNLNMSMVDKTMFSSGLNMTQATLDGMHKAGLVQEVTQQADGREFTVDADGKPQAFDSYGAAVHSDEVARPASTSSAIPFLDTDSPWQAAVPVDVANNITTFQRNMTRAAFAADAKTPKAAAPQKQKQQQPPPTDPIEGLTKKKLQEILRQQALPVSGTKAELQTRLRQRVNALLQGQASNGEG